MTITIGSDPVPETKDHPDPLTMLEGELRAGLRQYWQIAGIIFHGGRSIFIPRPPPSLPAKKIYAVVLLLFIGASSGHGWAGKNGGRGGLCRFRELDGLARVPAVGQGLKKPDKENGFSGPDD